MSASLPPSWERRATPPQQGRDACRQVSLQTPGIQRTRKQTPRLESTGENPIKHTRIKIKDHKHNMWNILNPLFYLLSTAGTSVPCCFTLNTFSSRVILHRQNLLVCAQVWLNCIYSTQEERRGGGTLARIKLNPATDTEHLTLLDHFNLCISYHLVISDIFATYCELRIDFFFFCKNTFYNIYFWCFDHISIKRKNT